MCCLIGQLTDEASDEELAFADGDRSRISLALADNRDVCRTASARLPDRCPESSAV